MKPRKLKLYRDLIRVAQALHKRRLWERFSGDDPIEVYLDDDSEPWIAVVMGSMGIEFGFHMVRGLDDFAWHVAHAEVGDHAGAFARGTNLSLTMDPFGRLPRHLQETLQRAGLAARRETLAPVFLATEPGPRPRVPDERELRTLQRVIGALVAADERGDLTPEPRPVLAVSGPPRRPTVSVSTRESALLADVPLAVPGDLVGLPPVGERWLLGIRSIRAPQPDGTYDDVATVLALDAITGDPVVSQPAFADDPRSAAGTFLRNVVNPPEHREPGLPTEIVCDDAALLAELAHVCEALGVSTLFEPHLPELDALQSQIAQALAYYADEDSDDRADGSRDADWEPADDDRGGWLQISRRLEHRYMARIGSEDLDDDLARNAYFGKGADRDEVIEAVFGHAWLQAYSEWLLLARRARGERHTLAERLLAEHSLPPSQRRFLEAAVAAPPSLYRVDRLDAASGAVDLADILTGERVHITDGGMARTAAPDIVISLRLIRVGSVTIASPAGPILAPSEVDVAIDDLERQGLRVEPEALARRPGVLGRLWLWKARRVQQPVRPVLTNSDGDLLELQEALFRVKDANAVERALRKRRDIEFDEQADEFIWLKPAPANQPMLGDDISVGRVRLIGDELLLNVNSTPRLHAARKWIEQIPGVTSVSVQQIPLGLDGDEPAREIPLDDRLDAPGPMSLTDLPPEVQHELTERFREHLRGWPDLELPALEGATPREACRTPEGRRKVGILVRTMSSPMPGLDIDEMRTELLETLGIADGARGAASVHHRRQAAPQPARSSPPGSLPRSTRRTPMGARLRKLKGGRGSSGAPACGLCGKTRKLTRTECCDNWICDDLDNYVMFSFSRDSCLRNHQRYTLCGVHHGAEHEGEWQACEECRTDYEAEYVAYYGTNEYNFTKLANPPSFVRKRCADCDLELNVALGGFTISNGPVYRCTECS